MSAPMRIVVAGRDAALWLSVLLLQRALAPAGVAVAAVELPAAVGDADIYPALPPLEALHVQIGIDEAALLRATGGCFTLGQYFTDAAGKVPPFLHAHGGAGSPIAGEDFFAYWLKALRSGLAVPLEDFSLAAAAAKQGRLLIPDEETAAFCRSDYGYHLPAAAYVRSLRALAEKRGIAIRSALTLRPVLDPACGDIVALDVESERIVGGLFIDTTGSDALLIRAIDASWESWRAQSPADRLLVASGPALAPIPVHAEVRAWDGGWTALHPGIGRTHIVQVYAAGVCSDDEALKRARSIGGLALTNVATRPLDPGQRTAWRRNCIAIGEAACGLDPVHGVDLHAIQLGLVHLLACFPAGASHDAQRTEYNRVMRAAFERVRDFQSAHYALARYAGGFWEAGRNAPLPPAVAHAVALFQARGEVAPFEAESFLPDSWRALFLGHGLVPDSHLPAIDRTPLDEVKVQFRHMLSFIRERVQKAPTHDQYLARIMAHTHG